jgi:hypothetical protein
LGEAGCGPGVEREVIENFSKGLVTSRGTAKGQGQGQGQSSDARTTKDKDKDKDSTGESYMYGKQSYRMGSQGKKRSREEGEGEIAVADEFALFQAFQSSENDKCLYIPVPIRYKAHRDLSILSGHPENAGGSAGTGAVTGRRGEKKGVSSAHTDTEDRATATDLRSCPLLKRGFRAFGKVVGHFILRKIASAGRDTVCSSSSSSSRSSSSRAGMIVIK